jgi:hypothetical protein
MATGQTEHDHDNLLPLLLKICEDFLNHTSPATRSELDTLLCERGITGGPSWLIDMLALTRMQLQHQHYNSALATHHDA